MRIPYYGEIIVTGKPFCEGCKEADLQIETVQLFAEAECIERQTVMECKNLKKCIHLREVIGLRENERR